MEQTASQPRIPESFFEHKHFFGEPWVDKWTWPNPFIGALAKPLRADGVELTDFSFNNNAANFGENYLNIAIRKFNAAVRVGIDNVNFIAANPDWEMAPQLFHVFGRISDLIQAALNMSPTAQEAALALHVTPGAVDFRLSSSALINPRLSSEAEFCGVSVHRSDSTLIIDKSLRYPGAAFVRLQRRFTGDTEFTAVAKQIFEDEVSALRLLGLPGVV